MIGSEELATVGDLLQKLEGRLHTSQKENDELARRNHELEERDHANVILRERLAGIVMAAADATDTAKRQFLELLTQAAAVRRGETLVPERDELAVGSGEGEPQQEAQQHDDDHHDHADLVPGAGADPAGADDRAAGGGDDGADQDRDRGEQAQPPHAGERPGAFHDAGAAPERKALASLGLLRAQGISVEGEQDPYLVGNEFLFWTATDMWRRKDGRRSGYGWRKLAAAVQAVSARARPDETAA